MAKTLKITQTRSLIGSQPKHKRTMKAIGFHRHQETLTKTDTPQLRGMLTQVRHLVRVEEVESSATTRRATSRAKAKPSTPKASAKAKTVASPDKSPKASEKAAGKAVPTKSDENREES